MAYILDTHVLLWSVFDTRKLSTSAQDILLGRDHHKCISISTIWEIAIKNRIGKLPLSSGVSGIFSILESRGYGIIGIDQKHIEAYNNLPLLHLDPFDGIIIATALVENMTIVTADENMRRYSAPWAW